MEQDRKSQTKDENIRAALCNGCQKKHLVLCKLLVSEEPERWDIHAYMRTGATIAHKIDYVVTMLLLTLRVQHAEISTPYTLL